MPLIDHLISPDEPTMFLGYRNVVTGLPDVYHSLSHWYESEKFRGIDEALRDETRSLATGREARKFALRCKDRWRSDWKSVRVSVMKAGLAMAAAQAPTIRRRLEVFARSTPLEVATEFESRAHYCGYPLRWYAGVVWEAADKLINNPVNLLLAGVRKSSYIDKKMAVDRLVNTTVVTGVLCVVAKEVSWCAEEYALHHCLPLRYLNAPRGRLSDAFVKQISDEPSHVIVLERKGGKQFDGLLHATKQKNKAVRLVLLS